MFLYYLFSDPNTLKLTLDVFAETVTTSVAAKVIPAVMPNDSFPASKVLNEK
jgi:hypothetical protein